MLSVLSLKPTWGDGVVASLLFISVHLELSLSGFECKMEEKVILSLYGQVVIIVLP